MPTDVNGIYTTTCQVSNSNGDLVAPVTKILTVTAPDQTTTTPAISVVAAGNYYVDVTLNQEGLWQFTWATTGPNLSKTDYENAIVFRALTGFAEMRSYLGIVSTARDDILRFLMSTATDMVEDIVGPCVIRTITNQHIPGDARQSIRLPSGPLPNTDAFTSLTSVWPGGPTWLNADVLVYPDSGVIEAKAWRGTAGFWYGPWTATYVAGRTVIPNRFVQAYKLIVADLWAPMRGLTDDPLAPDYQQQAQYEAAIPAGYEMPPQALALIKRHAMPGFA
jgi:hypothetical protein